MMRAALLFFVLGCAALASAADSTWQPTTWQGEQALVSSSQGWKAIVSLERGRLMHFGPADRDVNLLFAPPTRANRNAWGGHRLWLGPQATWPKGWPPPDAWEYRGPESWTSEGGVLRMVAFDTNNGWPRLIRTYRWDGAGLVCGAEFTGGDRPAQFVQIFQVPAPTVVTAEAHAEKDFPAGYVTLPSTAGPFAGQFAPPPHVTRAGDELTLRHIKAVGKFGFRPQALSGTAGGFTLKVSRGNQTGAVTANPDQGFFTQVYLSSESDMFIELEQLSPMFAVGQPAKFEVILTGMAP